MAFELDDGIGDKHQPFALAIVVFTFDKDPFAHPPFNGAGRDPQKGSHLLAAGQRAY